MRSLVFDIETASVWDELGPELQALHTKKWVEAQARLPLECRKPIETDGPAARAALSPWTSKAIVIAMLDTESGRGRVLFEKPSSGMDGTAPWTEDEWRYEPVFDEVEMLETFWEIVSPERAQRPFPRVVTFNGRGFDGPFLMTRSSIRSVPCTRNLVPYRYSTNEHADLADLLTYYGAVPSRPSLDIVCRTFGIETPKKGISGAEVGAFYTAGKILDIARYAARDVTAESELLARLERTTLPAMNAPPRKFR
jgi:DNA polymerase elongation subunit (family B)